MAHKVSDRSTLNMQKQKNIHTKHFGRANANRQRMKMNIANMNRHAQQQKCINAFAHDNGCLRTRNGYRIHKESQNKFSKIENGEYSFDGD